MAENKDITRTGVYLPTKLIQRCDLAMATVDCKSRSEFIRDALEHYIAVLNAKSSNKVLTPALESVISGRISMTEDRLSRILFKLGVEVAIFRNCINYGMFKRTIFSTPTQTKNLTAFRWNRTRNSRQFKTQ